MLASVVGGREHWCNDRSCIQCAARPRLSVEPLGSTSSVRFVFTDVHFFPFNSFRTPHVSLGTNYVVSMLDKTCSSKRRPQQCPCLVLLLRLAGCLSARVVVVSLSLCIGVHIPRSIAITVAVLLVVTMFGRPAASGRPATLRQ